MAITTVRLARTYANANSYTSSQFKILLESLKAQTAKINSVPWPGSLALWTPNGEILRELLRGAYRFLHRQIRIVDRDNFPAEASKTLTSAYNLGLKAYKEGFFPLLSAFDTPLYFDLYTRWRARLVEMNLQAKKALAEGRETNKSVQWSKGFNALISSISSWQRGTAPTSSTSLKFQFGVLLGLMNEVASIAQNIRAHNKAVAEGTTSRDVVKTVERGTISSKPVSYSDTPPSDAGTRAGSMMSAVVVEPEKPEEPVPAVDLTIIAEPDEEIEVLETEGTGSEGPSFLQSPYLWIGVAGGLAALFLLTTKKG